ncbi:MAG TPA: selenocysteine-specific translation elongation factor [Actinomycetota bacterium]|nr:selenocysteine-specific translation elongation factor [Actinomycetota bacterium]
MYVVATAGHVDHGKSTLIRALTGIDPDRLEEEKRRGLTIDLGFAWLDLAGQPVGVVDVPGHERFIRNMLAGVGAVNAVLFVVAANEGWRPQSQEHLDIIDLLGISTGVVAVTKADLVGSDDLKKVSEQIRVRLASSTLAEAPMVPVSAESGSGLDELKKSLSDALDASPSGETTGRPRLWIDRIFTIKGAGTVVTGTLTGGGLLTGAEVQVLPHGLRARIRSIQSHKTMASQVPPGTRVALNLSGVEKHSLGRGDVVAIPGDWEPTRRLLAELRFLPHLDHKPSARGAFKLYLGSQEADVTLRFLGDPIGKGEAGFVAITASSPLIASFRDRFVLRESGRRTTVGGGAVLEPRAEGLSGESALAAAARRAAAPDQVSYARVLLDEGAALTKQAAWQGAGVSLDELRGQDVVELGNALVAATTFESMAGDLAERVAAHHARHPLDPGLPLAEARRQFDEGTFDALVQEAAGRRLVVLEGATLRTPEHDPASKTPEAKLVLDEMQSAGFSPPTLPELTNRHGSDILRSLIESAVLVKISSDIVFSSERVDALKSMIREHVESNGPFTVAEFRDMIKTTRKYAIPLLEYLDQHGFTRREGDTRVLGPRA